MTRYAVSTLLLLGVVPLAQAQQPAAKETIMELKVSPARAPVPALRYQLLPEPLELKPGNPALGYLKCFAEQHNFFYSKESSANREKWLQMPLEQLPVKQLRDYGGMALRRADDAARLDGLNWQALPLQKWDPKADRFAEIWQLRILGLALQVRLRGEIADGRFDDAMVTMKTNFAMARHLQEHPTVLAGLFGIAIGGWTADRLFEMVQQPGSPSLFWALTDLPSPLVNLRKGAHDERTILEQSMPAIDLHSPMTEAGIEQAIRQIRYIAEQFGPGRLKVPAEEIKGWIDKKAQEEEYLQLARQRLMAAGTPKEAIDRFPSRQIVLANEWLSYRIMQDDLIKLMGLPFRQAEKLLQQASSKKDDRFGLIVQFNEVMAGLLLGFKEQQAKLEQQLAVLRHIEAIRMYAGEHMGQLPGKLSDIDLPLPLDPVTGEPFEYAVAGNTATLRGGVPTRWRDGGWTTRYVLTIRK